MSRINRLLAGLAVAVLLAVPTTVEAQSECSEYISGRQGNPTNGQLVGFQSVTETSSSSTGGSAGVSVGVASAEGNAGRSGSASITFYVGFYKIADGSVIPVRCDTYELYVIF